MSRRTVGAVLAGGRSERMGRPKHAIVLEDGRTMAGTVADALAPLCDEVVVVGPGDALPGRRAIADRRPGCGPLAGIEALLESGGADRYLVVPCDMPRLDTALLRRLLDAPEAPMAIFAGVGEERIEALPARVDASLRAVVAAMLDAGERAVHRLASRTSVALVAVAASERWQLANLNRPEDVEAGSDEATKRRSDGATE